MKKIFAIILLSSVFFLYKTLNGDTANFLIAGDNDLKPSKSISESRYNKNFIKEEGSVIAFDQADLWDMDKVRDIHINFSDSLWQAMQPYGGLYGEDGKEGKWHEGNMLYPTLLKDGDKNFDGNISYEEFMELGRNWFDTWDTAGTNVLDWELIKNGINSTFLISLQGPEGNGIARVAGVSTPAVRADLNFEGLKYDSVTIRYKGNGTLLWSQGILKKPLKLDLNDGFPGRKLAGSSKLNFHNLEADPGKMNDAIAYQLYRDCGVPAPRTTYARIYMNVPDTLDNEYLGLYLMVENVDDNFTRHWYGTKKGELLKPVTNQLFEYFGDDWTIRYARAFDPKTKLTEMEEKYIIEICKFASQAPDEEFYNKLWSYFDLDNFARYFAVTVFISEIDGIMGPRLQNFYFFIDPKSYRLSIIPWDHDHSFGNAWQQLSIEEVEQLSIEKPWIQNNYFLERIFKDEEFNKLYRHYLNEFSKKQFQPEHILSQIDELGPSIRPSIEAESKEKLNVFDFTVGWNIDENDPQDSAASKYPVPLRAFIKPRYESVSNQLSGKDRGIFTRDDNVLPDGWIGSMIMKLTDENRDGQVTRQEFMFQFDSLYTAWGGSPSKILAENAIRNGIEQYLSSYPSE